MPWRGCILLGNRLVKVRIRTISLHRKGEVPAHGRGATSYELSTLGLEQSSRSLPRFALSSSLIVSCGPRISSRCPNCLCDPLWLDTKQQRPVTLLRVRLLGDSSASALPLRHRPKSEGHPQVGRAFVFELHFAVSLSLEV